MVNRTFTKENIHQTLNFHTSIVGTSGSGKTELAKQMNNYSPESVFFVNTMRHSIRSIPVYPENWSYHLFPHTQGKSIKISIAPKIHQKFDEFALEVDEILNKIITVQEVIQHKRLYIFIDEIGLYDEIRETLKEIAKLGRNYNMFLVSISQRPQDINKTIFSQSNMLYSSFDDFDLTYLKRLGIKPLSMNLREFVYYPKASKIGDQYTFTMKL